MRMRPGRPRRMAARSRSHDAPSGTEALAVKAAAIGRS
jgi:hypothetical protein